MPYDFNLLFMLSGGQSKGRGFDINMSSTILGFFKVAGEGFDEFIFAAIYRIFLLEERL